MTVGHAGRCCSYILVARLPGSVGKLGEPPLMAVHAVAGFLGDPGRTLERQNGMTQSSTERFTKFKLTAQNLSEHTSLGLSLHDPTYSSPAAPLAY